MAENQENIEAQLCAYIDGELDERGRAEIEKHLADNPQHRRLIETLMQSRDLVRALPREKAPEDLIESMQHQIERSVLLEKFEDDDAMTMPRMSGRPHVWLAAAIVLLVVGLGAVIYFVLPNTSKQDQFAVAPAATAHVESAPATAKVDGLEKTVAEKTADKADVFERRARGESKMAAKGKGGEPMFDNSKSAAAAGPMDARCVVIVDTDNAAVTNGQVTGYLASNGIQWQSVTEPMPPPIELEKGQVVQMDRAQSVNVQLKKGPEPQQQIQQSMKQAAQRPTSSDSIALNTSAGRLNTETSNTSEGSLAQRYVGQPIASQVQQMQQPQQMRRNVIVANMTRQQAAHLSDTLGNSRVGQRATLVNEVAMETNSIGGGNVDDVQKFSKVTEKEYFRALPLATTMPVAAPASPPLALAAVTTAPTTRSSSWGFSTTAPVQTKLSDKDLDTAGSFSLQAGPATAPLAANDRVGVMIVVNCPAEVVSATQATTNASATQATTHPHP